MCQLMGDCMKGGKHSKLKEKKAGKFPSLFSLQSGVFGLRL